MGYYHQPAGFFVELSCYQVAHELIERVRTLPSGAGLEDYACYVGLIEFSLGEGENDPYKSPPLLDK